MKIEWIDPQARSGFGCFEDARRAFHRGLAVHAFAGIAYAVLSTSLWFYFAGGEGFSWRLAVVLICTFLWPGLITVLLAHGPDRQIRGVAVAGYFIFFAFVALFTQLVSPVQALTTENGTLSPWQQFALLWILTMLPPSVVVLAFYWRLVRAALPLFFVVSLLGMFGVWGAFMVLDSDSDFVTSVIVRLPVNGFFFVSMVLVVFFIVAGSFGWSAARCIGWLYQRRVVNDQTLMIDAVWLSFIGVQSVTFALERGPIQAVIAALALFGFVKALTVVFTRVLRTAAAPRNHRLLFLRNFRDDWSSQSLIDSFGAQWRFAGSIQLIGAKDLATTIVRPTQFLDFLRRRLKPYFISEPSDLETRIAQLEMDPDGDGRFRINELFCFDHTWKITVTRLLPLSDFVLMDLRGFSSGKNLGSRFELQLLLETGAMEKTLLVIDDKVDIRILAEVLEDLESRRSRGGANTLPLDPTIRVLKVGPSGSRCSKSLFEAFAEAR